MIIDRSKYAHYCTLVGAESEGGFRALILLRTTYEHQSLLADYNIAETASSIRHLLGFRQAAFYLGTTEPVVLEHVVWETSAHFEAAREHPGFTRHLHHVNAVASHSLRVL